MVTPLVSSNGLLTPRGITDVFHYAPLHYVLFIGRCQTLLSKNELRRLGYNLSHFRRTSRRQDEERGFSDYVHLTLDQRPPILKAKLAAGFPHFEIRVPARLIEQRTMHLCRFNIAKCRVLRRGDKPGPIEIPSNGRYHGRKQLPTAETPEECNHLLAHNCGVNMIEVLIPSKLELNQETQLIFFSSADRELAERMLGPLNVDWKFDVAKTSYFPRADYVEKVCQFLSQAVADPHWRGDGMDFDNV